MRTHRPALHTFLLCAACLSSAILPAATVTWDTSTNAGFQPGDGIWGTDAFWSKDGITSTGWVAGDEAVFLGANAAVTNTISVGTPQVVSGLSFGSAVTSGNWALSGAGGLALSGNGSFSVASGSVATIGTGLTLGGYALAKTGAGTLRLNTPALANPIITVTQGILELQKASSNYSGGSIAVAAGAELAMRSTDTWGAAGTATAASIVLNGGALSSNGNFNSLNAVTLNGGTIRANGGVDGSFGSFQLGGTVTANQDASIVQSGTNANVNLASTAFTVNAGATLSVGAVLQSASTLTKGGIGSLLLSGANTFTGGTALNAGSVQLGGNTALGAGAVNFANAYAQLSSDGTTARTLANALTFNNQGLLGDSVRNGLLTFTGGVTMNGDRTLALLSDVVFAGAVGGTGNLRKAGVGSLTLSGTNTLSGTLSVDSGKLTLDYSTNNTAKFAGVLNLQGGLLELTGGSYAQVATSTTLNGGVTLSRATGTSTLSLGAITRNTGGCLNVTSSGVVKTTMVNVNGVLSGVLLNGALAANDGANNIVAYAAFTDSPRLGGLIANNAANNVRITDVGNSTGTVSAGVGITTINTLTNAASAGATIAVGTGNTLRLGAVGVVLAGAGMDFTGGTLTAGGADNVNGEIQYGIGTGSGTIGSVIANNGSGIVSLVKTGAGILVLSGANTNTGTTFVQQGTLEVLARSNWNVASGPAYRVESGATLKLGLSYAGGAYSPGITVLGAGVADNSGLQLKAGINYSINGLGLDGAATTIRTYGATGSAQIFGFDSNVGQLTVNQAASGSVIDARVNIGMGSWGYRANVLAGANTASGDLIVNGQLVGSGNGIGFVKVGTGSVKLTGDSSATLTGRMNVHGGSVILAGGNNRLGSSIDFNFAGDGKLVLGDLVTGSSSQTIGLSTASTATSSIVGGSSAVSALTWNLASATSFMGKLGGDLTNENNLAVVKAGAGVLTLASAGSFTGGTIINAGGITLGNAKALGAGTITVNAGGTLDLGAFAVDNAVMLAGGTLSGTGSIGGLSATSGTVGVSIVGTGSVSKTGSGELLLLGGNTYTGGTTVSNGQVTAFSATAFGVGAVVVSGTGVVDLRGQTVANNFSVSGGTLRGGSLDVAKVTGTSGVIEASLTGGGGFTKAGAGTLSMSGQNTFTGGTVIQSGTLRVDGTLASAVTVNAGARLVGTGAIDDKLTILTGGSVGAGAVDVGTLSLAALELRNGTTLELKIVDGAGLAGVGFDRYLVSGALDLSATSLADRITLRLSGLPARFNPAFNLTFTFLDYGSLNLGGASNITDHFAINTDNLFDQNGKALASGSFSVLNDTASKQLSVAYTSPIPEPSTYGLGLGALGLAIAMARRRRVQRAV